MLVVCIYVTETSRKMHTCCLTWVVWQNMDNSQTMVVQPENMENSQKMVIQPVDLDDVDLKIGFIGAGKMAQALCAGFINAGK